ncbi:MAG: LLM class flavin-dependent oxidoreductase [Proteobacteria bacterium]|nr:LLM class flavin-dependent oxidoreductase [Pseudomonadota bacterium]MBK8958639.1 LLM class flavin-dependent oxidoreductase [Pseudomonadota bacterium]
MYPVRFGVFLPTGDVNEAMAAALRAERDGLYSVSTNDHFFSPLGTPQTPQNECFTILTAIAAVTSKIRLAPAVAAASFRTPALLAKIGATLDHVSRGRFIMGLGAGWQDKEYLAAGYPFPPIKERLAQLDETIQVLKAMWTQDVPNYRGQHFEIKELFANPRPLAKPHPQIMLGGSGTGLLRIAAREASIINLIPPTGNGKDFVNDPAATLRFDMADLKRRIGMLHGFMREAGREPSSIELGGLVMLGLSRDKDDATLRQLASHLGFPSYEAAQKAPVALLGTPQEVKRELEERIANTGVTYYIVFPATADSQQLLVDEIMPAFC